MGDIKIVKFFDVYTPCTVCQFECSYCYVRQRDGYQKKIESLPSASLIRKAFNKERMGGAVLLNLCAAGETLLSPEIPEIVKELIDEGHFFSIVTNGIATKAFDEFIRLNIPMEHLFFKFSFHYLELMRTGKMDSFIQNVKKIAQAGASYTVEMLASDDYIPYIPEIKKICQKEFGAMPHLSLPRDDRTEGIDIITNLSMEEYRKTWDEFDSELFRFKLEILHKKRTEYCHAGEYSYVVNLQTGDIQQCLALPVIGNLYNKMDEPLPEFPVGHNCKLPYCYNGHVFLALGNIRLYDAPTYYDVRDRITINNQHWVTGKIKDIFSEKLYYSNKKEYSKMKVITKIEDLADWFASQKRVVIYGAGAVSSLIISFLRKSWLIDRIEYIIVTQKSDENEKLDSLDIKSIDEVTLEGIEEITAVFIATMEKSQGEIFENIKLKTDACIPTVACSDGLISLLRYNESMIKKQELATWDIKNTIYKEAEIIEERFEKLIPEKELSFSVHLCEHCNLNCAYCNNCSPLAEERFTPLEDFKKDIERLSILSGGRAHRIQLTGGEPLLNPDAIEYAIFTRQKFPYARISFITNGLLLNKLPEKFFHICKEKNIDIDISPYPIDFDYESVREKLNNYGIMWQNFGTSTIKTMTKEAFDLNPSDSKSRAIHNWMHCYLANRCIQLKEGKLTCTKIQGAQYFIDKFPEKTSRMHIDEDNYIDIYQAKSIDEILEFFARPYSFCKYCDVDNWQTGLDWKKSERKLEEWVSI